MDLFLENYSLDELSNMPLEDLANYLRMKGRNRFPDPEYVAKSIQKAVHWGQLCDDTQHRRSVTQHGRDVTQHARIVTQHRRATTQHARPHST